MAYRSNSARPAESDAFWPLIGALLALLLFLVAFPGLVVGFFVQRFTSRYSWSFAFWFFLLLPGAYLLYVLSQHDLTQMMVRELTDYLLTAKHAQLNLAQWNFKHLWSETWPVWLRTLALIPVVGLWQEVSTNASKRGSQTTSTLVQQERRRQRRLVRAQQRARKRTRRPERLPDVVGGMMVIGVPIDDEEQE